MAKVAERYLLVEPWRLVEDGFDAARGRASESLFSLANEHCGVRGYFDEGYSGDRLQGCYVSGVLEEHVLREPLAYRGVPDRVRFVVNSCDWLYTRIEVDGEILDLEAARISSFRRELDFRTGELRRAFVWETASGRHLELEFARHLSLGTPEVVQQRLSLTALDSGGPVAVTVGLDFSTPHEAYGRNFWSCPQAEPMPAGAAILGVTDGLGHKLFAGFAATVDGSRLEGEAVYVTGDRFVARGLTLDLERGRRAVIEKTCVLWTTRNPADEAGAVWSGGVDRLRAAGETPYASITAANEAAWRAFWDRSDIEIEGDDETQQGIRFCLFQLHQTYRGVVAGSNIGAKGLSGEAYNGNAFWDTETYCLPFYLFGDPAAARALLDFRYRTLPQALERAKALDCEGACFPIATCDGTESCTLWQHASLQLQPTTAVAYGIWHYVRISGDIDFLYAEGAELLIQISRFLASRGQWSPRRGTFGYYAVMGPDEFQMMVNNNAYTNYMAKRTFEYTLRVLGEMEAAAPERRAALLARLGCSPDEQDAWRRMAERMFVPFDPATTLYEQHEGFFDLPHLDVDAIPVEDFPLYHHWSYDRIYRNDMIKQPDVLMFMFLYDQSFTPAEKRANYEYYEPRCIHESSLSPSVHSILAAELGKHDEAFEFFRFATRIDLDDYNRNVREGIHITSIAAAWMNIVYGFGGFRSDGDALVLGPTIPRHWTSYSFGLTYRGSRLRVHVTQEAATLQVVDGAPIRLVVDGRLREIGEQAVTVERVGVAA